MTYRVRFLTETELRPEVFETEMDAAEFCRQTAKNLDHVGEIYAQQDGRIWHVATWEIEAYDERHIFTCLSPVTILPRFARKLIPEEEKVRKYERYVRETGPRPRN